MNNDTITINGFDLSEVIDIIEIIRPVGNERHITTNDAPLLGVNLQEVRTGAKIIKVKFAMQYGNGMTLETAKHKLAGIFNTSEAVKIVISDEPDKYYMGLVSGSVDMDNITRWFQKGSFDLIIPDGVAHSSTYKRFDNGQEQPDKVVFNLVNNGNVPAFPVVTVKNNAENGYIGIVNTSGAFEVGDRKEADTETVKHSEVLLDFRGDKIAEGFARAVKNSSVTNSRWDNITGTSELTAVDGKKRIKVREQTSGTYNENYGAGLSWEIPADSTGQKGSLNDYIFCKLVYQLDSVAQCGFIKVTVTDANNQFLYGIETYKRYNGLYCGFNVFATNNNNDYNFLKTLDFDSSSDQNRNPFAKTRGQFEIMRNDERVQVYYNGSHYNFFVPEIRGKKSAKIHVTIGGFHGKAIIPHLYLDELLYRKDFVQASRDIPNRYPMGSNIILDSENDSVTVDGIEKAADVVQGSKFLSIPPGSSQLEVYCSSWVKTKPTVKVEFKERYL
ncbi:distal tail protein Dit [Streptococcus vulneris]|uniref:Phage tail family protein n=1 Tax=Streptococcus vulneris TaxID=2853160 RepID=A0ABS6SX60_9STRE|nr:distal tail protein Dit [Streptococcus vulneris]MBV7365911.1 phage tail family protein [Streptococcus vulneris]